MYIIIPSGIMNKTTIQFTIIIIATCIYIIRFTMHNCDHRCENQSFVKYEFCETLIFKCSLFIDIVKVANEIWYPGKATIALRNTPIQFVLQSK